MYIGVVKWILHESLKDFRPFRCHEVMRNQDVTQG
jgi:hypothetical protein